MSGNPSESSRPPDDAARQRIRTDLDATLFVEAGAGAGKTTALVDRIVELVRTAGVPITSIAAITFTEKAAAELRSRLRSVLEAAARESGADAATVGDAAGRLDHAPIGTLHAFARRILFEFPVDAGLPPGFRVLDELESGLAFDEGWDDLLDRLLDESAPPGGAIDGGRELVELCEFDGFGITRGMRRMAEDFQANWDLVETRVALDDPGALRLDVAPLHRIGERIAATAVPPDDTQADVVATIAGLTRRLADRDGLRVRLEALAEIDRRYGDLGHKRGKGAKAKWKAAFGPDGPDALAALQADEVAFGEHARRLLDRVRGHRRVLLGAILGRFVLDGARERTEAGLLEFHDLLVLARRLVATRPVVRRLLHDRYTRLLLDEFQDTDPIQLEIAVRLSADPDAPAQSAGDATGWRSLQPLPGRLFIVGDPKQSIYRFRRADIAQYLRAADQVGADALTLSANFRSTRAVIDFTNAVFSELIAFTADTQPGFAPLDARRRPDLLGHGSVSVLGADLHDDVRPGKSVDGVGGADVLRLREAQDVVAAITTALRDEWPVVDHVDGESLLRPCRPGDICVLLPTRISLPALESELRRAGVSYRAENSSVVYATREIRDLLLTLRAADDPTDALALVAALRSPLYGCTDVELWEWAEGGGSWSPWARAPEGMSGHPVGEAIAHVRSLAERVGWITPADLLALIADETRLLDVALTEREGRDVWRRVRYVIEQARAWADAGGHGVRRYLQWARLQASESRLADTILPEHDDDAVRVMTIHAAKGLEFPITIVAGLTTRPKGAPTNGVVWADDTWMLAGKGDDGVFDAQQPLDEQMSDAERRRLLYVACTRAVDHLVVSLHRGVPPAGRDDDQRRFTSAELLATTDPASLPGVRAGPTGHVHLPPHAGDTAAAPTDLDWADSNEWAAERAQVLRRATRRSGIAATRLSEELSASEEPDDPGLDKRPVNIELPPWQRGRYGTSIGRAVHGVLQFCDLAEGDDIENLARAQCAAEGVIGLEVEVTALARSALAAPVVRDVVDGAEHWRELFVAAPVGDRVLEGYVDLLVRAPTGLVIVDYKTDQWSGPVQSAERVGRYRLQLAAYAVALETTLGEPVTGGILVRCRRDGPAEQIVVDEWPAALAEVRRAVS